MRRRVAAALRLPLLAALALALGAAAASAQEAPAPPKGDGDGATPEVWHAQAVKQGPAGVSITYYWSKGRSLRAVTVVAGHPVVTLVHGEWYYAIDEISGEGIAVQRSPRALQQDREGGRPFGREATLLLEAGAERVSTEEYGGTQAHVYRLSDRRGRREVWVPTQGEKLPLYVELFDRGVMATETIRYLNWSRELDLPDRFFEPDPRLDLQRLTYQDYLKAAAKGPVGPVPVLYGHLLHGPRPEDEVP